MILYTNAWFFTMNIEALAKNQGAMEGPLKVAGVESMGLGSE